MSTPAAQSAALQRAAAPVSPLLARGELTYAEVCTAVGVSAPPTARGIYTLPSPWPGLVRCCIVGHRGELLLDGYIAEQLVTDQQRARWELMLAAGAPIAATNDRPAWDGLWLEAPDGCAALGAAAGDQVYVRAGARAATVAVLHTVQDVPRSALLDAFARGELDTDADYGTTLRALQDFAHEPLPGMAAKARGRRGARA